LSLLYNVPYLQKEFKTALDNKYLNKNIYFLSELYLDLRKID